MGKSVRQVVNVNIGGNVQWHAVEILATEVPVDTMRLCMVINRAHLPPADCRSQPRLLIGSHLCRIQEALTVAEHQSISRIRGHVKDLLCARRAKFCLRCRDYEVERLVVF